MKDKKESVPPAPATTLRRFTFSLTLTDRPGGMELIAATFAHRGVSIHSTLGSDGALNPDGRAQVIVAFSATPARKEALKGALSRLSRVVTLVEYEENDSGVCKTALVRIAGDAAPPKGDAAARVVITVWGDLAAANGAGGESGEATFLVVGAPAEVDALIADLKARGVLRAAAHATLAL